jgi:peroxiredoxin Q/BCP
MSSRIREGDRAPDFTLGTQDGRTVSLRDFLWKNHVVLYFYPKDFTAGCTTEARAFSANYEKLIGMGAEVIGVSSDPAESHAKFADECGAKFILVSDVEGRVRDLYGVHRSMGLIPGRVTFVIDREGIVRHVFSSQLNPKKHVEEAIDALNKIEAK